MSFDVGVSSRNECGLSAAISLIPRGEAYFLYTMVGKFSAQKVIGPSLDFLNAPDIPLPAEHPFAALTGVRARHSTKRSANGHRASQKLLTRMWGR